MTRRYSNTPTRPTEHETEGYAKAVASLLHLRFRAEDTRDPPHFREWAAEGFGVESKRLLVKMLRNAGMSTLGIGFGEPFPVGEGPTAEECKGKELTQNDIWNQLGL